MKDKLKYQKEKWLIALDIDRTLIPDQNINSNQPSNHILDDEIKILNKLNKKGHKIVIATGRSLKSTEELFKNINLNIILSNFNGCYISIPKKNKILLETKMDLDILRSIAKEKILQDIKYNLIFKYLDHVEIENFNDQLILEFYNNFDNFKIKKLNIDKVINQPISAYMHLKIKDNIDTKEILNKLKAKYNNQLNLWYWRDKLGDSIILEINNKKYNKWSSILFIANKYKIKKENIITIGDNLNDYEMIKNANHGVAMINGLDEIKEIANHITKYDNNNNGVSDFLSNFFDKIGN
ncbi:MAG: haloacid dehalogenase [Candidatus Hepatoplasma scabrum]|nr:MAG: haloacid dehalogenase [Candidatus Hepatoplasma sp.]